MGLINKKILIGIILIIVGLIIFLSNMDFLEWDFTLFVVSTGFFAAYYSIKKSRGKVGFLITASITLMLGFYNNLANYSRPELSAVLFFVFMGTAFLLIFLLHYVYYIKKDGKTNYWSLYTAGIIYLFSLFIYLIEVLKHKKTIYIISRYWPLAVIAVGIIMVSEEFFKKK